MKGSPIGRGRGRPRKIIYETIEKDLDFNSLSIDMVYDKTQWHCLIYVTPPSGKKA